MGFVERLQYNGGQRGCQDRVLHLDSPMPQVEAMTVLLRRTDDHWGLRPGTGSGGETARTGD